MSSLKPIFRRPKAAADVEHHATFIADGSIDAALRFLERAEQTIKGLAMFPASGAPFPSRLPELAGKAGEGFSEPRCVLHRTRKNDRSYPSAARRPRPESRSREDLATSNERFLRRPSQPKRTLALLPSKLFSEVELEFTIKETPKPTPSSV